MYLRKHTRKFHFLRFAALCLPLLLVLALLTQTASAKTYVISDGELVFTYTTKETNPETVLDLAGLELTEQDSYTTETGENGTAITVRRAQAITVDCRGEVTTVHTFGETVGSLLNTLNIILEPEDILSHDPEELTRDGMEITVTRILTRQETYTTAIAHETSRVQNPSIPAGTESVLVEGRDGEMLCTAEVTYVNGQEVSRQMLEQTVLQSAVEELIAVGTGEAEAIEAASTDSETTPIIGENYIILPTGEVLTYTGTAQVRATAYTHTDAGCDLITATGSTVHIGTVAVDPRYIPYGTRMFIVANDGSYVYGISEAEDCGGAIKGDRVDLYFPTYAQCMEFGWRNCTIYFLG